MAHRNFFPVADSMGSVTHIARSPIFWGEISPSEHAVHVYGDDEVFMDALEGFIGAGLRAGEAAIVIATPDHLARLEERLDRHGFDVEAARREGGYLGLPAERILREFMVDGWPDEQRFHEVITTLLGKMRANGRRVRAFGEMVALLWSQGHVAATVRLEHLWNKLCEEERFPLFCAYPRAGFTGDPTESLRELCAAHTRAFYA
jgi:DcmR-like sensory protein